MHEDQRKLPFSHKTSHLPPSLAQRLRHSAVEDKSPCQDLDDLQFHASAQVRCNRANLPHIPGLKKKTPKVNTMEGNAPKGSLKNDQNVPNKTPKSSTWDKASTN